mmetsp:Transcript_20321/g.36290  ORF Transcript_20321/g.36290 Transcript_20321/m.36290 type:complete len:116 (-) Transcript_20321:148-495(-)
MNLTAGIWDKKQNEVFAMCQKLRDKQLLGETTRGSRFRLYGSHESAEEANRHGILDTILKSRKKGAWKPTGEPSRRTRAADHLVQASEQSPAPFWATLLAAPPPPFPTHSLVLNV